jgi:hypothetical protein
MTCEQCFKETDDVIRCPNCGQRCCDDCIAGRGVQCFQCENGDDDK